jgi:hypothetical protein
MISFSFFVIAYRFYNNLIGGRLVASIANVHRPGLLHAGRFPAA